ncbi:hypothetical protein C8R46DRAFT_1347836 [Mycena filopes]|nr:hypothetical protein C8R46DRAFT_1347836 [Mycena filopes]
MPARMVSSRQYVRVFSSAGLSRPAAWAPRRTWMPIMGETVLVVPSIRAASPRPLPLPYALVTTAPRSPPLHLPCSTASYLSRAPARASCGMFPAARGHRPAPFTAPDRCPLPGRRSALVA